MEEERVGVVTHFFSHLSVAAVMLEKPLKVGDSIHIVGHTSDFTEKVNSMQLEHDMVTEGQPGQEVAITVVEHGVEHDVVYLVAE